MSRKTDDLVRVLASGIGWISLGIGLALTLAPLKSASFLGMGYLKGSARVFGAVDLIVGTGLLLGRRRSRWMSARALLNAVLAVGYARTLAVEKPPPIRARGGLIAMICLTVFDHTLSRRLRGIEAS